MKMTHIAWVSLILAGTLLSGCASTHAENKQTALDRWEHSTAFAKLPTVESLIERGRLDEARKTLQQCLAADPELAQAHYLSGRISFIENRRIAARESFETAVALDHTLDKAWYYLAILISWDDHYEAAMQAGHNALALKSYETDYIIAVTQLYMHAGHFTEAHHLLEDKLHNQPRNRELLLTMAELYHRLGQLDQTAVYYEKVLLLNPDDAQTLESLGYCYAAQKNWAKATDTFERLLQTVRDEAHIQRVLRTLGRCALNAERYNQAIRYYDRLSTLRRNDPDVWLNMARAALGAGLADRAAENARRALVLNPGWTQAYAVLGAAQYLQGHHTEALRSFSYLRNDDELGGFAWFMSGRCYAQLGQLARAEAAYKQAADRSADGSLVARFLNGDTL